MTSKLERALKTINEIDIVAWNRKPYKNRFAESVEIRIREIVEQFRYWDTVAANAPQSAQGRPSECHHEKFSVETTCIGVIGGPDTRNTWTFHCDKCDFVLAGRWRKP